ncbi:UNKNOWN [Stylonychia lemnae]|uniref:Uncharacterized protein n=1 Tax=Stylonychia lemnae TaxID=5949 RepID=A0A077ZTU6_STYLE|nr:UNKNOWN [Stylonychia lemnae]|eukprot:CDW73313.1 UNKNOWN [Stylonychia lemnae]
MKDNPSLKDRINQLQNDSLTPISSSRMTPNTNKPPLPLGNSRNQQKAFSTQVSPQNNSNNDMLKQSSLDQDQNTKDLIQPLDSVLKQREDSKEQIGQLTDRKSDNVDDSQFFNMDLKQKQRLLQRRVTKKKKNYRVHKALLLLIQKEQITQIEGTPKSSQNQNLNSQESAKDYNEAGYFSQDDLRINNNQQVEASNPIKVNLIKSNLSIPLGEIKRMSNIVEELHEDEDETNSHKRQSMATMQNKTFEDFKFESSPMTKFKQPILQQNDSYLQPDVGKRISVLTGGLKKQTSSISELRTMQSMTSAQRFSIKSQIGFSDLQKHSSNNPSNGTVQGQIMGSFNNNDKRISSSSNLTIPETLILQTSVRSPMNFPGMQKPPLMQKSLLSKSPDIMNNSAKHEKKQYMTEKHKSKTTAFGGLKFLNKHANKHHESTHDLSQSRDKIDIQKDSSIRNLNTIQSLPSFSKNNSKKTSLNTSTKEIEDEGREAARKRMEKRRFTKHLYTRQQQVLSNNQSNTQAGRQGNIASSDPDNGVKSIYMQSIFLKKWNRDPEEEEKTQEPVSEFQKIAENPVSALNLDKNSDAYRQLINQPLSYKIIQARIDMKRLKELDEDKTGSPKSNKDIRVSNGDEFQHKSGMAYSKSQSTMVPRRKNLFKAMLTKKLAAQDQNNKSVSALNLSSNPTPNYQKRYSTSSVSYKVFLEKAKQSEQRQTSVHF